MSIGRKMDEAWKKAISEGLKKGGSAVETVKKTIDKKVVKYQNKQAASQVNEALKRNAEFKMKLLKDKDYDTLLRADSQINMLNKIYAGKPMSVEDKKFVAQQTKIANTMRAKINAKYSRK